MWKRKLFILPLLALLLGLSVFALDAPDLTQTGSVTISTIPGGAVTIYQVGTPVVEKGDASYVYTEDFAEFQEDPQFALTQAHLDSQALAGSLWDYTLNGEVEGAVYAIEKGSVTISGLSVGVYLIGQTQAQAAQGYSPINPFLVTVPLLDGDKWDYSVDANPKVRPISPEPSASPGPSASPKPSASPGPSSSPNPAPSPQPSSPQGPGTQLPDTGQTNWPVPVLAVSGLVLFMLGWGLRFAGRKSEHEK